MADEPDDPHELLVGTHGQAIVEGKLLLETLKEQEHYTGVLRIVSAINPSQLAALALTVAAESVAQRTQDADDGAIWERWWEGVDSSQEQNPTVVDTSPAMIWERLRPDAGP